jgi:hypothetical protein
MKSIQAITSIILYVFQRNYPNDYFIYSIIWLRRKDIC